MVKRLFSQWKKESVPVQVFSAGIFLLVASQPILDYLTLIGVVLALGGYLTAVFTGDRGIKSTFLRTSWEIPMLLPFAAALMSLCSATDKTASLYALLGLGTGLIIFYLVHLFARTMEEYAGLISCLFMGAFAVMVATGLYQLIFDQYTAWMSVTLREGLTMNIGRLTSFFFFPNTFAAYLLLMLPLTWWNIIHERWPLTVRIILLLMGVCGIACLILTLSRAAWICAILEMAMLMYSMGKKGRAVLLAISVAGFIALLSLSLVKPGCARSFVAHGVSDVYRVEAITTSLHMFCAHPVSGIGIGNFRNQYVTYLGKNAHVPPPELVPWHTHNLFLNLLAEMGLAGLGAFLLFLGIMIYRLFRAGLSLSAPHNPLPGMLTGLCCFLIFNQFDFVINNYKIGILTFTIMGFCTGAAQAGRPIENEREIN